MQVRQVAIAWPCRFEANTALVADIKYGLLFLWQCKRVAELSVVSTII